MNNTSRRQERSKQNRSKASPTGVAASAGEQIGDITSGATSSQIPGLSSLTSWSARYDGFDPQPKDYELKWGLHFAGARCKDLWSGRDVDIYTAQPADAGAFDDHTSALLLTRARVLQGCDHTHIIPVRDYFLDGHSRFIWTTESRERKNLWQNLLNLKLDNQMRIELISQFVSVVLWFDMQPPHAVPAVEPHCLNVDDSGNLWLSAYQVDYLFNSQTYEPFSMIADFIDRLLSMTDVGPATTELLSLATKLRSKPVAKEVNTLNKLKAALRHMAEPSLLSELA